MSKGFFVLLNAWCLDIKYHISCFDTVAKQAWQFSKICRPRIASCVIYNSNICVLSGGLVVFHICCCYQAC